MTKEYLLNFLEKCKSAKKIDDFEYLSGVLQENFPLYTGLEDPIYDDCLSISGFFRQMHHSYVGSSLSEFLEVIDRNASFSSNSERDHFMVILEAQFPWVFKN